MTSDPHPYERPAAHRDNRHEPVCGAAPGDYPDHQPPRLDAKETVEHRDMCVPREVRGCVAGELVMIPGVEENRFAPACDDEEGAPVGRVRRVPDHHAVAPPIAVNVAAQDAGAPQDREAPRDDRGRAVRRQRVHYMPGRPSPPRPPISGPTFDSTSR